MVLRARVKGLSIATIARLYFDPDTTTEIEIERLRRTMRDDLVAAALRDGSSALVSHSQAVIAKFGEPPQARHPAVDRAGGRAMGDRFTGPPVARTRSCWRPFAPGGLARDSQRYAVRAIRVAFAWPVAVRYLAGNPRGMIRVGAGVTLMPRSQHWHAYLTRWC